MKIVHLIQRPQLRGAEMFACQLSNHIIQSGNEAVIVSLFPGKAELPFEGKHFNLSGNSKKRFFDYIALKRLAAIIKEQKPDVVQANAGDTLHYAVLSKLLFGWKTPIVFRNASTISLYIKSKWTIKWHSLFFSHAKKIISVSATSANDFAKLFPQYAHKIVHIPIGIENALVQPSAEGRNPFEGISEPVIVHVGGFTFEKNHKGLISIFEKVLQKMPQASLHLFGDGPLRPAVEQVVNEKGLQQKVLFYGFQKDPLQFVRHAQVLVLPSLIEGLPGVILEAFSCKTPVVAYDTGGIKEVVMPQQTGYLVKKGDEEGFADAIEAALKQNDMNKNMIAAAHDLVTSRYTNDKIAAAFLDVYLQISTKAYPKKDISTADVVN